MNTCLRDDLLRGVAEIADYTGEKPRRIYHLLENGLLPGGKKGGIWFSRKSALDDDYDVSAKG